MRGYKRIVVLVVIMAAVAVVVAVAAIGILYDTALEEQRARLIETAQSHARLMEAVARFDSVYSGDYPEGAEAATISQIIDSHEQYGGFGETGEFTLARREGDEIVFILRHRYLDLDKPKPVPFDSELAEAMRRALSGQSGTLVGPDYRGVTVLAAYEPVAVLDLGIVAKIDLAEIRAPLLKAGGSVAGIALIVIVAGSFFFFGVGEPMVREIQKSEERYRTLVETMNEGLLVVDENGVLTYVNEKLCEMLGYSRDELVGRLVVEIMDAAHRKTLEEQMAKRRRGEAESYELGFAGKDGRKISAIVSGQPVFDEAGRFKGSIGAITDITGRKAAEAEVERLSRQNELILNAAGEGIFGLDLEGRTTFVNPAAARMIGWNADGLIGMRPHDILHHTKPDGTPYPLEECPIYAALSDGEVHHITDEVFWRKDGTNFPVEYVSTPIREDGNLVGAVVIFLDITERKQAEEALRRSQKMDAIGQLTGGIAHDFNNLLAIIIGNLDFLKRQVSGDKTSRKRVETALKSALRGADLTSRLLAFSRQQPQAPQATDINRLVKEMEGILTRSLTKQIEVETRLADGLWLTVIDPSDLEDTILNLAINARDAMPNGGKLVIETSNTNPNMDSALGEPGVAAGDYVLLSVWDTGVGMSQAMLERVFDPFFTTKPRGKGTGLGLSLVYGFVKRSGGHIKIYSEPGVGTMVRIYLPRASESSREKRASAAKEAALARGNETILVVEDESDLLEVAESYLGELGYRTIGAMNSWEALKILEGQGKIDLLFSDVVMPGDINGYDLARCAVEQQPGLKVLLTSGLAEKKARDGEAHALSLDLLSKPYQKADLARRVRQVLDNTV